ncbi:triose-phosphate isomerase [Candidatus Woesearchaeota archaeon]|nr:triose-phosphate isomerase [Candidatus Woesearchaeota archaeon]
MRRPFIAANWKMNKTLNEAKNFANEFKELVKDVSDTDILVCVPYTLLCSMKNELKGTNINIGAENVFYEDSGAYTGEISALMIKDFAEFVIVGHSERRKYFGETNDIVNKKIKKALEHDLKVVFCIGETLEKREKGITKEIVGKQVREGLSGLEVISEITIAYEPVWAIGTGKTATPEQAQEMHSFIRDLLEELFGEDAAEKTRILYGGSVKPHNVKELMEKQDIDGGLVGGASLDAESFSKIVKFKGQ